MTERSNIFITKIAHVVHRFAICIKNDNTVEEVR